MLLIFVIAVLVLAIALLIGMHFMYEAEIKTLKGDSKQAIRQARDEGYRKGRVQGWDEGTLEERDYWIRQSYDSDATDIIPVTRIEEGYPVTQWVVPNTEPIKRFEEQQTGILPTTHFDVDKTAIIPKVQYTGS